MRRVWLLVALAALLVPRWAAAQSAETGQVEAGAAQAEGGDDLPPMMRDPRKLSGIPRGESTDPAGQLTVRAVQGAMKRTEFGDIRGDFPAGTKIHLVAIDPKGEVTLRSVPLDAGGRAVFDRLATNGSRSYFALALFPRKGAEDRLLSQFVTMPPQVGIRMMLAGEGVDSDKPPVDDLKIDQLGMKTPGPGMVEIQLRGDETVDVQELELIEAGVEAPIQRAKIEVESALESPPVGQVKPPQDDRALRRGLVEVLVTRRDVGLPGISVEVARAGAAAGTPPAGRAETDASGRAVFESLPAGKYVVRAEVQGRTFASQPFDPPRTTGQRVRVEVDWREGKVLQAHFAGVPGGADKVYLVRAVGQDRPLLTMPFQLTASRGAATYLIAARPVLFSFHGGAWLEDDKLNFQLQVQLYNTSVAPYQTGREGLHIPLARGFTGASVGEEVAAQVKVDEDRGLVWRGFLPPGVHSFVAGFVLPSQDGRASVDMPTPFGLWSGQLMIEKMPGLRVDPPPGVKTRTETGQDGKTYLVHREIQLDPGQSLTMSFSGLPEHPAWEKWVRRGIGTLVLGLLGWGMWGFAVRRRAGGGRQSMLEAEREELLQSVVQLEADLRRQTVTEPVYQRRRGELLRQLEAVYAQLAEEGVRPDIRP